jgi:hypothetical protein
MVFCFWALWWNIFLSDQVSWMLAIREMATIQHKQKASRGIKLFIRPNTALLFSVPFFNRTTIQTHRLQNFFSSNILAAR